MSARGFTTNGVRIWSIGCVATCWISSQHAAHMLSTASEYTLMERAPLRGLPKTSPEYLVQRILYSN
jgi:hypothetical protein